MRSRFLSGIVLARGCGAEIASAEGRGSVASVEPGTGMYRRVPLLSTVCLLGLKTRLGDGQWQCTYLDSASRIACSAAAHAPESLRRRAWCRGAHAVPDVVEG
jgi:hypothetical protein